jgi:hypothetical protein
MSAPVFATSSTCDRVLGLKTFELVLHVAYKFCPHGQLLFATVPASLGFQFRTP